MSRLPKPGYGGALLTPLRDTGSAKIYLRASPEDARPPSAWSPVTVPVSEFEDIFVRVLSGNYLGVTLDTANCNVEPTWTDPPPEALLGGGVQIVRPGQGLAAVLSSEVYFTMDFSPSGGCVAYRSEQEQLMYVRDLESNVEWSGELYDLWRWVL